MNNLEATETKENLSISKVIIFTDLYGTLLDRNGSFEAAKSALDKIKEQEIPLVFITSRLLKKSSLFKNEWN